MKYIITFLIALTICFCGCKKITFTLPRDNSLDTLNPNYHIDKSTNIVFDHYEITKEIPVSGSPNVQINAGDCIYLLVHLKNSVMIPVIIPVMNTL